MRWYLLRVDRFRAHKIHFTRIIRNFPGNPERRFSKWPTRIFCRPTEIGVVTRVLAYKASTQVTVDQVSKSNKVVSKAPREYGAIKSATVRVRRDTIIITIWSMFSQLLRVPHRRSFFRGVALAPMRFRPPTVQWFPNGLGPVVYFRLILISVRSTVGQTASEPRSACAPPPPMRKINALVG